MKIRIYMMEEELSAAKQHVKECNHAQKAEPAELLSDTYNTVTSSTSCDESANLNEDDTYAALNEKTPGVGVKQRKNLYKKYESDLENEELENLNTLVNVIFYREICQNLYFCIF